MPRTNSSPGRVRYGVVGLGWFSQVAVLPAFAHAKESAELVALFSSDRDKLDRLGDHHGVAGRHTYEAYDDVLRSGGIDAVYLAVPNHLHREYTERAAHAGVHVLCEKPMAVTVADCQAMMDAVNEAGVRLMIAYRLHFHDANMKAVDIIHSGRIGDPRIFNSTFTNEVQDTGNIRLSPTSRGGGPIYDIGVYCINAARYLFREEPLEVCAFAGSREGDARFSDANESVGVVLRFPGGRIATFNCGFGGVDHDAYEVIGTRGKLRVVPAYEFGSEHHHELEIDGERTREKFPKGDQVAPEIVYFSDCIRNHREPEPSGQEGLADVRVVEAIHRSIDERRAIELEPFSRTQRPGGHQAMRRPPVGKQELIHSVDPSENG